MPYGFLVNSLLDYKMDNLINSIPDSSMDSPTPKIKPDNPAAREKKSAEMEHMEAELRLTLEEIARLQNALAEANMKNTALQQAAQASQSPRLENNPRLMPVLQELKQPIHTIQGYLDLLSNESVGILGTFQKRFIERITSSINHMESILKSFEAESGGADEENAVYQKEFSLTTVMEETLSLYTDLIRSKMITLKVEFEKNEISFIGDQETFERILNILFTNAYTSVAEEGTVSLGLKILQGKKPAQVLVSIQSSDHDSPKAKPLPVNLEEFKDTEIRLEGFGSTIKDMVKARDLVNEMHGKMEVFSVPSSGSLIRVRLPVSH